MRALLVLALIVASGCRRPPPTTPIPTSPPPSPEVVTAPPRAPARSPARTSHGYEATMMVVDVPLFVVAWPLLRRARGLDDPSILAWLGLYLAGGPVIHAMNGNETQVGWSLARRVGFPAVGAIAAHHLSNDCEGDALCAIPYVLGVGLGMIVGAVIDWTRAHVAVEPPAPVVIADGDRVVIGIGGRF